jgi:hypothetical protein
MDRKNPMRLGLSSHLFVVLTFEKGVMVMDVGKLFVSVVLMDGDETKTASMIKFIYY